MHVKIPQIDFPIRQAEKSRLAAQIFRLKRKIEDSKYRGGGRGAGEEFMKKNVKMN